ncbi:MAG TPA: DUF4097 family beta strand repeat-containing protein [Vicinamibacterales bacterium]
MSRARLGILPAVLLLCAACSFSVNAEPFVAKEEKTFAVTGRPELSLRTFDGSIEVTSWDRPEVALTIERRAGSQAEAEALEVTTSQDGNRIVVEAKAPARRVYVGFQGPEVRFVVSMPAEGDLTAASGDGSIAATGISGRVELRSGDGSVRGERLRGEVVADTGDGSIALSDVAGRVRVNTGDGSVRISGAPNALEAHTGDGSIALELTGDAALQEDWELTTGDGSVRVALPPSVNAELDARTGDGAIDAADFGLRTREDSRHELRGPINAGGKVLRIRTGDGSITVAKN